RVQRLVVGGDLFVLSVHRQKVLHQIVGAEREEADLARQRRYQQRRRRHLDHRADRRRRVEALTARAPLVLRLARPRARPHHLFDAADDRQQDRNRMVGAHAQKRAQLRAQQRRVLEQEADTALRQRRIARRRQRQRRQLLVAADVEQAEGHWPRVHAGGGALEEFVLLVLARQRRADEEAELGAVEADAFGVAQRRAGGVGQLVDVGQQRNGRPVERDARKVQDVLQLVAAGAELRGDALVLAPHRRVGVYVDD